MFNNGLSLNIASYINMHMRYKSETKKGTNYFASYCKILLIYLNCHDNKIHYWHFFSITISQLSIYLSYMFDFLILDVYKADQGGNNQGLRKMSVISFQDLNLFLLYLGEEGR